MKKIDEDSGINEKVILTKEEAVRLHREMWRDMAKEEEKLGEPIDRNMFKLEWCLDHGYKEVNAYCFLCEYVKQIEGNCNDCPVNWGVFESGEYRDCCDVNRSHGDLNWEESPIIFIANAPLKNEDDLQ